MHGAGLRRRAGVLGPLGAALARRVVEQEIQPRALGGVQGEAIQGKFSQGFKDCRSSICIAICIGLHLLKIYLGCALWKPT